MRHNIFDYAVLIYFMVRSLFFNIFFSKILSFSKQDTFISIILGIIISIKNKNINMRNWLKQ